jgi:putative membrane protein
MGFIELLITVGIFAIIALLIVLLVRVSQALDQGPREDSRTPDQILQERYARGEIDSAEFEERRKNLQRDAE